MPRHGVSPRLARNEVLGSLGGDLASAPPLLSADEAKHLGPPYVFMRAILDATRAVLLAPVAASGRGTNAAARSAFREVRPRILRAAATFKNLSKDREQLRLYKRALRRLAKAPIGLFNKLSCRWRALQKVS